MIGGSVPRTGSLREVGLELRSRYLLGRAKASPSLTGMVQLLKFIVTTRWVLAAWIHQKIIHLI
jgi:hypothetical protein